ncbi:MAG: 4Fe-4S binding protein [Oscillospiraceae bacterium]|nr:4Fe-4S binding protein [Oscillospiraceae bacterium]
MITIDFERCKGCALCTGVCPKNIIALQKQKHNAKGYYTAECTDNGKCISCAMCAMICPDCAIRVEKTEK